MAQVQSISRSSTKAKVSDSPPRFNQRDRIHIAEYISDLFSQRKRRRAQTEQMWDEIDRQKSMTYSDSVKRDDRGRIREGWEWLPEGELPWQAYALETLTADARRMMFPDAGPWFRPHVALTDEYLARADMTSMVAGDVNDVPTRLDQEGSDMLVHGLMEHWMGQYDFQSNMDMINAESFSYGYGVGRLRLATKNVFLPTARGIVKQSQKIPYLSPKSIRNVYPDDSQHFIFQEGMTGGGTISCWSQRLADLVMQANRGSNNPRDEQGGWMPSNLSNFEPDNDGNVQVLEYEGDIIVPRSTRDDVFIPNVLISVAQGQGADTARVFRIRFRTRPESSWIFFPYHREDAHNPYPTSPLMKGYPIQKNASQIFNLMVASGYLQVMPPVRYSKDDMEFAADGGPQIYPGAKWGTLDAVDAIQIGNPDGLLRQYLELHQEYADTTGVNAPRLGAQTVSHTTAFSKDAELQRGVSRTVDYVRSSLKGGLTQALSMMYQMGRDTVVNDTTFYVPAYQAFAEVDKDQLPDLVQFEVHGSGGPQEEQQKRAERLSALREAIQIDMLRIQMGEEAKIDTVAAIEQILGQGGWTDVDVILRSEGVTSTATAQPGVPGGGGGAGSALPASIQALALQGQG